MSEIMEYAGRLLARREYSVGELRRKLAGRWPGSDEIEPAIERLLEDGLLSDRRFAEAFARSRVARFQGPRKIRAELAGRSVSETDIEAVLQEVGGSWTELASEWLARQGGDTSDYDGRARYYRRLLNRGFTHDQAMNALSGRGAESDGV